MEPKRAPYAPPSAVLNVIRHYRSRDIPEYITITNLRQIGVTEALANRTMAALRFLELIREDATTTDQFRALRYASDEEYQAVLGGILDSAYKDVFDHIELSTAGDRELNNAFIPFSPGQQRSRMITLFLALAKEAGRAAAIQAKDSAPRAASRLLKAAAKSGRKPVGHSARDHQEDRKQGELQPRVSGAVAFGVTDSDLAALPDTDFDAVWAALGKLARARANAAREKASTTQERDTGGVAGE